MSLVANDTKSARQRLGVSQRKFAALFGISVKTLQNWEQGRSRPTGAAVLLLRVITSNPDAVLAVVNAA